MSKRRDPDIMAIDHAYRALKKSTPRMLMANCNFLMWMIERLIQLQKGKKGTA